MVAAQPSTAGIVLDSQDPIWPGRFPSSTPIAITNRAEASWALVIMSFAQTATPAIMPAIQPWKLSRS